MKQPNCGSNVEEIDGVYKIIIYSLRPIAAGEELTYDYKFEVEEDKLRCQCGSINCQGRLN
jgi:SET domain-containing protein